ncbi:MAG: putative ribosomal small subunit methyltransferase [Actinomycetota bacterium]
MNERLRRSAAHLLVDDVIAPVVDDTAEHHLRRVLRVRHGEEVSVTDGRGGWRICAWSAAGLEPLTEVVTEPSPDPVTVVVAVPKQDRPEWIVAKLAEIGVDEVRFVLAERSVVRWDGGRAERNVERFAAVARSALEQSRRVWACRVSAPVPAWQVLGGLPMAEPGGRAISASDRSIAIGPEGGWTPEELGLGSERVDLGPNVLRVETAALLAGVVMTGHRR